MYLYAANSWFLGFQEVNPLLLAIPHQVATATSLQLGDQSLVGQPQLLAIIGSGYPGNHRLTGGNNEFNVVLKSCAVVLQSQRP